MALWRMLWVIRCFQARVVAAVGSKPRGIDVLLRVLYGLGFSRSIHCLVTTSREGRTVFRIFVIALLALGAWKSFEKYQQRQHSAQLESMVSEFIAKPVTSSPKSPSRTYSCDGRQHCSQMTSCEEAYYFLRNCPGTKMDGDHDGIPCEQQWCR